MTENLTKTFEDKVLKIEASEKDSALGNKASNEELSFTKRGFSSFCSKFSSLLAKCADNLAQKFKHCNTVQKMRHETRNFLLLTRLFLRFEPNYRGCPIRAVSISVVFETF